ncbi:fatty acid alpha-hydroxylase [Mitosporidium daphniae]|uniref:Ceramide very long chain fatty acid hydroxylase n=1 Tax=Mitosporidium daphniae TaxID=1485682 RepID=A0A098VMD4_9MICR|nr:inositolphosphorylceramide-B C-26 hydroxylase [Mitosporidium daphniae]KGG50130.1 inositolphosphorylceramide-B C-26 hydroxylase [Mitosporidium daphniae]|eukprot:XP_013236566.1 inositolphosphorylceramide-B C-26 hydroxylase [Mitosporidium daphniae]
MIDTNNTSDPIEAVTCPAAFASMEACKTPVMPYEEVKPNSFILLFKGVPHDIGPFISDHPGGSDILKILEEGSEISELMCDKSVHVHSALAYRLLEGMKKRSASNGDRGSRTDGDQHETQNAFLDLSRPLVWQLLSKESKFSKADYLNGIHTPQFLHHSARLFESDLLESLSKTAWWVIPLIWIPAAIALFTIGQSISSSGSFIINLGFSFFGLFLWSFVEYMVHRFLFHIDNTPFFPDNKIFLLAHFFLHGIHHFMPMDPYRLVMPPLMTLILGSFIWGVLRIFTSNLPIRMFIYSGLLVGYVWYDLTHYHLHHYHENYTLSKVMGPQEPLRKKHNGHHYRSPGKGFGVSSSFWDHVFGTMIAD